METFDTLERNDLRTDLQRQTFEDLRERFPVVDLARLEVQAGEKGQIQVRYSGKSKWYNLYQRTSTKLNSQLSKEIKDALGKENMTLQLQGVENQLSEQRAELDQAQTQRVEIQGQIDTEETARQQLAEKDTEIARLKTTIDGALTERQRILQETAVTEEQLKQATQALEDLERQIEKQRRIINDGSEEERADAVRTLEILQERVAELQRQKGNLERELGLTTKEKIKRALLKYGVPFAIAVDISSAVGVIITMLKGAGAGVKKLGQGLTALGKKMAAAIPGLLGSVLSLVLKTGGELLKFVGNNIWILVVAIGMVVMKKMKS